METKPNVGHSRSRLSTRLKQRGLQDEASYHVEYEVRIVAGETIRGFESKPVNRIDGLTKKTDPAAMRIKDEEQHGCNECRLTKQSVSIGSIRVAKEEL